MRVAPEAPKGGWFELGWRKGMPAQRAHIAASQASTAQLMMQLVGAAQQCVSGSNQAQRCIVQGLGIAASDDGQGEIEAS